MTSIPDNATDDPAGTKSKPVGINTIIPWKNGSDDGKEPALVTDHKSRPSPEVPTRSERSGRLSQARRDYRLR